MTVHSVKINDVINYARDVKLEAMGPFVYAPAREGLALDSDALIGGEPDFDDDDEEVMPIFAQELSYIIFTSSAIIQDVVNSTLELAENPDNEKILRDLYYYLEYDTFFDN